MVSIVMPAHNREKTIVRAINSIIDQTYKNFEIIIVDDFSTDNTSKIISSIKDQRVRYFCLSKNQGAAAARNYGIRKAKGELISFLDSDDYYEEDFLKESVRILEGTSPNVGFMWTGIRFHFSKGNSFEEVWKPQFIKSSFFTFLNELKIGTGSGITIKKEVFNNCGFFDEALPAAEDTEFFYRITQSYDYTFSARVLINIDKSGNDRMSKDFTNIGKAYNSFIPNYLQIIDSNEKLMRKFYYKMMWLNYHLGDKKEARMYYKKIPRRLNTLKIKLVRTLFEIFPKRAAAVMHKNLSF
ncbi:glycosyltransferase family 2 protein [Salinimicrobium sp. CDJ15-81-2]|nr:glycosyltransferase family 2 protein [Salinimicrobium nanhaiense]